MTSFPSRTALALLGALLALTACAGSRSLADLPDREVAGHYTAGPEGQWFHPCAAAEADEAWWVTFTGEAVAQQDAGPFAELLQGDAPVFVRWRAAMGDTAAGAPEGPGPGTRYALVRAILEARPASDGDCR